MSSLNHVNNGNHSNADGRAIIIGDGDVHTSTSILSVFTLQRFATIMQDLLRGGYWLPGANDF